MTNGRVIGLGLVGLLAAALVTGAPLGGPANTVAAVSRDQAQAATATSEPDQAQLVDSLITHFAARLDVDEAKLNTAFTDAVGDTVDQAVKDGKLTPEQAGEIKAQARSGLRGLLPTAERKHWVARTDADHAWEAAWKAAAATLALDPAQMKMELGSGKSLADIARERNVDVQQLQDSMLAQGRAVLDTAVHEGRLTQAQADDAYRGLTRQVQELSSLHNPVDNKDKG